jgi:maltose alpha-D-glucosyltransferase/alpha-amylase
VAAQVADPTSLLHTVRRLLALRASTPELGTTGSRQVLTRDYPLAYLRGDRHLVVVNPRREPASVVVPALVDRTAKPLEVHGADVVDGRVDAAGFGYGIFTLSTTD